MYGLGTQLRCAETCGGSGEITPEDLTLAWLSSLVVIVLRAVDCVRALAVMLWFGSGFVLAGVTGPEQGSSWLNQSVDLLQGICATGNKHA